MTTIVDIRRLKVRTPDDILRKIYGPVKENELWRIRRNDELEAINNGGGVDIVRFVK